MSKSFWFMWLLGVIVQVFFLGLLITAGMYNWAAVNILLFGANLCIGVKMFFLGLREREYRR